MYTNENHEIYILINKSHLKIVNHKIYLCYLINYII